MRHATFFATYCVALVTVLAIPTPQLGNQAASTVKLTEKDQIRNTLKTLELLDFSTQDYMANLIYAILGVTAGQFLTSIDKNMKELQSLIDVGMIELHQLIHKVDFNTQQRIQNVINRALDNALTSIKPILSDLGRVLPSITRRVATSSVSDLIYVLLGISFEEFLNKINSVLKVSITILTDTMNELATIANTIPDIVVANDLRRISNIYLDRGRSLIRPLLTSLDQILPSRDSRDVIANVMSASMGFDVVASAIYIDMAVETVENALRDFIIAINTVLQYTDPKIIREVNQILKDSIQDAESTMEPILDVLLHFVPSSKNRQYVQKDIISTLLGVSLEDFLFYVDFSIPQVQNIYINALSDIRNSCISAHPFLCRQIVRLIDETVEKVKQAVEPLQGMLSPILGERRFVELEEFVEITKNGTVSRDEKVFCNFSLRTGYNKNLIVHLISKIFGFDVVEAAKEMSRSFYQLDDLYTHSGHELNDLIVDLHPLVVTDVNRVLNNSLNTTRRVFQPMIDIFIEFIPTDGRYDKDIVAGIIHKLEVLKYDNFKNHVQLSTWRLKTIAETTMYHITQILESAKVARDYRPPRPTRPTTPSRLSTSTPTPVLNPTLCKVEKVLSQTFLSTQSIAESFFRKISPIFES